MSVQKMRLVRAVAVVAVALAAVALWNPVARAVVGDEEQSASFSGAGLVGDVLADTLAPSQPSDDDRRDGGGTGAGLVSASDEVPSWFEEEVVPLASARELRANGDWSVMGFVLDEAPADARDWMKGQLEERGWALVESGVDGSLSGVKEGGRLSWLLFSCTAVGRETCVVVQVPAA